MKKSSVLVFITVAVLLSGCTFNVSNGTNSTNASPANTTNSAPVAAENKAVNTAAAPKKAEEQNVKRSESGSSEVKPGTFRVRFERGETSTTVTKTIPAEGSIDFLMNVQKGQLIIYTVGYDFDNGDIAAFLTEPGLQDISQTAAPKEPKEFKVNKSGDHRLTVNNITKKKVTITLYLDVE